ncbi:hypothetical protein M433DRAFT_152172 [Acidomyces richmondensis BFW]|nr:MAG: hypothetical protein FE78DRAFT_86808 [Acidomyces sp. 'richmondensis']KYG47537.1 hypothetical protein M433DRAFT_152172 [Acidomyces richmondensis BFW]
MESTDLDVQDLLQTMFDSLVSAVTSLGFLTLDRSIVAIRILILSGLVIGIASSLLKTDN